MKIGLVVNKILRTYRIGQLDANQDAYFVAENVS